MSIDVTEGRVGWRGAVALLVLLSGGCADSFQQARQTNTVEAYRNFASRNPTHARLAEARRLEAEAAFLALSKKPGLSELRAYVDRYPDSPRCEQVKTHLQEMKLDLLITQRSLAGLDAFQKECPIDALNSRAREARAYLEAARKAFLLVDRKFFAGYLDRHRGGEFAEHAQRAADWLDAVSVKPQRKIPIIMDSHVDNEVRSYLAKLFQQVHAVPDYVDRLDEIKPTKGQLVYRISDVSEGDKSQIFNQAGELVEITWPGSGVLAEILKYKDDGKIFPVWLWGTPNLDGLVMLDFPVITWDTRDATLAVHKSSTTIGQISDFGRLLLVTTLDGFELYDPTFPDRLRLVYRYTRSGGAVLRASDSRMRARVQGKLVALFGEGVELVDCSSLTEVRRNEAASFSTVGQVTAGAWVGERFFFITAEGMLYEIDMDSKVAKPQGYGNYSTVTNLRSRLILGAEEGLSFYPVKAGGELGERRVLPNEDFPDNFTPGSPIVESAPIDKGLLVVNQRGEIALLTNNKLETDYISGYDVGLVYKLDADNTLLASLGESGMSLRFSTRYQGRWRYIGAIPFNQCQGVAMRYPLAYVACGDEIRTVHLGAIYKNL